MILERRDLLVLIGRSSNLTVFNLYCVRKESQSELPRFLRFYEPLTPLSYINLAFESPFSNVWFSSSHRMRSDMTSEDLDTSPALPPTKKSGPSLQSLQCFICKGWGHFFAYLLRSQNVPVSTLNSNCTVLSCSVMSDSL